MLGILFPGLAPCITFLMVQKDTLIKKSIFALNICNGGIHFFILCDFVKGFYCMRVIDGDEYCLSKGKGMEHPELSEENRIKLEGFYAEHNQRFYAMVGRDFGWPR